MFHNWEATKRPAVHPTNIPGLAVSLAGQMVDTNLNIAELESIWSTVWVEKLGCLDYTRKLTAKAPENMANPKRKLFQPSIFRGHVNFRGGGGVSQGHYLSLFNIGGRCDVMGVPYLTLHGLQGTAAEDVRIDNQCLGDANWTWMTFLCHLSGQIITTGFRRVVTLNGVLGSGNPPKYPDHSGLGIILICPGLYYDGSANS